MVAAVVVTVIAALIAVAVFLVVDGNSTKDKRDKYSLKRGQGRK